MGGATLGAGVNGGRVPVAAGAIGVFGGTFDPIHVAHLAVAQEAVEALGLERVVFVPAGQPPHKPGQAITAGEHRLAMVELAIAGNDRFAVDRIELDRPGPSYTVETLEVLRAAGADRGLEPQLTLILSAEAFLSLPTWNDPARVLELACVAVAPREGYPGAGAAFVAKHFPGQVDRVIFLDGPRLRLSATELRERAAAGRTLRYLVPDAVAAYIDDHDLYRNPRRNDES
jgi:nicotinate-nucleotide adenylyltransferase